MFDKCVPVVLQEWGKLKQLATLARRDLRLRVTSLRESCFAPGELSYDQDLEHMMTINSAIDDWQWRVLASEPPYPVMVEKHVQRAHYFNCSHDNGAGERRTELGDLVIRNMMPDEKCVILLWLLCLSPAARKSPRGFLISPKWGLRVISL